MDGTPVQIILLSLSESAITFYLFPHFFFSGTLSTYFLFFSFLNWSGVIFHKLIIYPYFRSPFRHLPKPPHGFWPIIGHGLIMFKRPPGAAHLKMMKETPNDGLIHFRGLFHADRLMPTTPAALADILVHKSYDWEKPSWVRTFLRQFLGDGLLISEGDEHRHQRKNIMPAFSFRHIKDLCPVFWSKSIELCEVVKADIWDKPEKVVEINHFSTQVTMDIIGLAGLGRDIGSLRNSDDELIKSYEEILEPTNEKGVYFVFHMLFPWWFMKALPWKLNERVKITSDSLKKICRDFVQEKRARMKMESEEHVDILSTMIRSNNFSDDGIVDQLLTFLAAGHETTSSALTWATHLLSINPSIQTRLRNEIHTAIPSPKALLDPNFDIASLLESLPYLNAVCNETLRIYPTIPVTSRVALRDTSINGQFVPKGTITFIVPIATNRLPQLWGDDAEEFKPERWIDAESGRATNNGGADSNYSFLTFLHGPRSCIGEKFARAEMRALIAAFCGSFEMEMANPNEIVKGGGTLTFKPLHGMKLKLKPMEWGT
ncbi:cytochrome P450 3A4 [Melanomma pulvis-pyrius CBS 109.77]|uniref:Cytochrome P450 3A4 n=1 Tax=Melanomma pulvis-pyrius CBS 109.77 TaxID=1314802 RepID=A0A6A6XVZ4_9PLEO|nr:cytochrome P450 3A4 [Melanomma pulvis-pyrius CBS 109.77]